MSFALNHFHLTRKSVTTTWSKRLFLVLTTPYPLETWSGQKLVVLLVESSPGTNGQWVGAGAGAGLATDAAYTIVAMTSIHGFKGFPRLNKFPSTLLLGT